ncbi:hypothetical protein Pmani_003931 [Petrolisthes manimaculis]|uniref:Uncharacterized protein n=1 Tax=Petrolisthes manimaculis TaxID=1843537 RepID=A0AAE1QFU1_9EUCA|nr:hypothetical protein Pmani_003931 [Petrolisthes manimaculis]
MFEKLYSTLPIHNKTLECSIEMIFSLSYLLLFTCASECPGGAGSGVASSAAVLLAVCVQESLTLIAQQ